MINHFYTLLLNKSFSTVCRNRVGLVPIDPDFTAVSLSGTPAASIYSCLFKDCETIDEMERVAAMYVTMVSTSELYSWVTYFDGRVSYKLEGIQLPIMVQPIVINSPELFASIPASDLAKLVADAPACLEDSARYWISDSKSEMRKLAGLIILFVASLDARLQYHG